METKVRTLGSLETGAFSVHLDDVILKTGEPGRRIRVDHPEASAVIPLLPDGRVVMVRQYRYALGMETLEIPAGKVDPGEDPETCARRELMEETGFHAATLRHLTTYAPAIGYSNERIHIFSAPDVEHRTDRTDEREIAAVEILTLAQLQDMIRQGLILDGKTLIGLLMVEAWRGHGS